MAMWEKLKQIGSLNVFPAMCLLLSVYFLTAFCKAAGIPPSKPLDLTSASYLALGLFFFILPEAKKLRLGKLVEYEAKVREIKEDVREFKAETRVLMTIYNSLISAISNTVNQTVNVNLPSRDEAEKAKEQLDSALEKTAEPSELEGEIERFLATEGLDLNYALAKMRMQIEMELRRILGKQMETSRGLGNVKYMPVRSLFSEFAGRYPKYGAMSGSIDYVLKICNAAIHGQNVSDGYAQEALQMGFRILDELKRIHPSEQA